jgi:hypothetical protein
MEQFKTGEESSVSRLEEYLTIKHKLVPSPPINPQVINSPTTLSTANPLRILPNPSKKIPSRAVILAPIFRITVAFGTASSEIQAGHNDPTKASVEEE